MQKLQADDMSLCHKGNLHQPVRITVQIWVLRYHQCGISALIAQASFRWEIRCCSGKGKFWMVYGYNAEALMDTSASEILKTSHLELSSKVFLSAL